MATIAAPDRFVPTDLEARGIDPEMAPPTAPTAHGTVGTPVRGTEVSRIDHCLSEPADPAFSDPRTCASPGPARRPAVSNRAGGRPSGPGHCGAIWSGHTGGCRQHLQDLTPRLEEPRGRTPRPRLGCATASCQPGPARRRTGGRLAPTPVTLAIVVEQHRPHRAVHAIARASDGADLRFCQPIGRQGDHLAQQAGIEGLLHALRMFTGSMAICGCLGTEGWPRNRTLPSPRRRPPHHEPAPPATIGSAQHRWARAACDPAALAAGVRTTAELRAAWRRSSKLSAGHLASTGQAQRTQQSRPAGLRQGRRLGARLRADRMARTGATSRPISKGVLTDRGRLRSGSGALGHCPRNQCQPMLPGGRKAIPCVRKHRR